MHFYRSRLHVPSLQSSEGTKALWKMVECVFILKTITAHRCLPRSTVIRAVLLRRSQQEAPYPSLKLKTLPHLQRLKMWRQRKLRIGLIAPLWKRPLYKILLSATEDLRRRLLMSASRAEWGSSLCLQIVWAVKCNSILLWIQLLYGEVWVKNVLFHVVVNVMYSLS